MTTLENSYCVPRTVEECELLDMDTDFIGDAVNYDSFMDGRGAGDTQDMSDGDIEIPVTRFLDLLHDRICACRLDEVGFKFDVIGYGFLDLKNEGSFLKYTSDGEVFWCAYRQQIATKAFVTTFTDLLTLIRMLTPPNN